MRHDRKDSLDRLFQVVNSLEIILAEREQPRQTRDDAAVIAWLNQGAAPEERLLKFDAWARKILAEKLDWSWAGEAESKRIEQCRIYLERIVLELWRRGWMLDGRRLANHIERAVGAVALQQKAGKIGTFWPYFQAAVDRYVGINAEEIREEAMRAGSHISQAMTALSIHRRATGTSIPELIAQRTEEISTAKAETLRSKLSRARQRAQAAANQAELL